MTRMIEMRILISSSIVMKKILPIVLAFTSIALAWCMQKATPITNVVTGSVATGNVVTGSIATWSIAQTGMVATGTTATGEVSQTFTVDLSAPEHALSFVLNSWQDIKITVEQPSVKAYVRVSQIVMPDGTMDGPFWSEMLFTAAQSWTYKFIISVNQMASEDVFTGSVTVKTIGMDMIDK